MLPQYDPTGTLESWLCLNRTSNPHLVRWINTHMDEDVEALELVQSLGYRYNLTLRVLAALDQVQWEDDFEHPPPPHHRDNVEFTTQLNMHPQRFLQRKPMTLSWA